MDAKQFIETFGKDEARRVATAAGTNLEYFTQIANGNRNASIMLAERLVTASEDRLDLMQLIRSTPNRKTA